MKNVNNIIEKYEDLIHSTIDGLQPAPSDHS
jgi:hypothetical protein